MKKVAGWVAAVLIGLIILGAIVEEPDTGTVPQASAPVETDTTPTISEQEAEDLIYGFCYVMNAQGSCNNVRVIWGAEKRIEAKVGGPFRERGNHHQACKDGAFQSVEDEERGGYCETAWEHYGCFGTKTAGFLQLAPTAVSEGVYCTNDFQ